MRALSLNKRISDPVHGTIELTEIETEIVSSRAFQRLHNVRQLGLAHYVFPGANYSRFAHSVGACHNAQRLIAAIRKNSGTKINPKEEQLLRIAALVHDLGHYPFSHAFEHEIEDFYAESFLEDSEGSQRSAEVFDHEEMGMQVLSTDAELSDILQRYKIRSTDIEAQFKKHEHPLGAILSSDLDCDRLDYLRRTAHHSGLPYGNVDIDYLIDQATVDSGGRFCFSPKALRAVDHLLVSRYFDYLQVPFHKSVVALEWSLRIVIKELLSRGKISCTSEDMKAKAKNGDWHTFDDNAILHQARELAQNLLQNKVKTQREHGVLSHIHAVLHRAPARVVAAYECVGSNAEKLSVDETLVSKAVEDFRREHDLCDLCLYLWKPKDFALIKASTKAGGGVSGVTEIEPEYREFVHICDSRDKQAKPIFKFDEALMHSIHDFRFRALRVFALIGNNRKFDALIKDKLLPKLQDLGMRVTQ